MTSAGVDSVARTVSGRAPNHLFGLDLVRCLAIGLVLTCHCGLAFRAWYLAPRPAFLDEAGYLGVELFFVLSGYLIGGIMIDLLASRPTPRNWFVFVLRRWFRTLPLYAAWVCILAMLWPPGLLHDDRASLLRILPLYVTMSQNLAWPQPDWFPVSWSLSIEEWFYVSFPPTLAITALFCRPSRALAISVATFLAVPLFLRLMQPGHADWNEYLHKAVVLRLDAIAFGVGIIALTRACLPSWRTIALLLAAGTTLLIAEGVGATQNAALITTWLGRAIRSDVTDIAFALMMPAAARLPAPSRWIGYPVRQFAAQSYATYITHYSILEWVGWGRYLFHWSSLLCCSLASTIILVAPIAIWNGFEKPILALRPSIRT